MSQYPRPWGCDRPLYVPPAARKSRAAFWTIGVPLIVAVAIAFVGMGFFAADRLGDLIGAMR